MPAGKRKRCICKDPAAYSRDSGKFVTSRMDGHHNSTEDSYKHCFQNSKLAAVFANAQLAKAPMPLLYFDFPVNVGQAWLCKTLSISRVEGPYQ